ncbi:MAG: AbrB/MazE/SpoVT family DNA-binding domain-containing protein [Spirochaetota bacterium]
MEAVLDKTGRIVIPHKIRENFHLEPGTELEVLVHGSDIILRVKEQNSLVQSDGMALVDSQWIGDPDIDKLIQKSRKQRSKEIQSFAP